MRLIDADELVKYLKKYHSMSQGVISDVEHFPTANMAIEALKNQATSKWIPCSDKLPDGDERMLVTVSGITGNGNIILKDAICIAEHYDDGWYICEFPYLTHPNITAWMPLPESYIEE